MITRQRSTGEKMALALACVVLLVDLLFAGLWVRSRGRGGSGIQLSADQVFAAVRAGGIPLRDNPATPGYNDQGCPPGMASGQMRENRRLQIPVDDDPDHDIDLAVMVMRDDAAARSLLEVRKPALVEAVRQGNIDYRPFTYRNVEVETQGSMTDTLAAQVKSAVEALNESAPHVMPPVNC